MATINSATNQLTSLRAKTGIGGLVSGMETDELIEKMTAASRSKIFKQEQRVQTLQWKQTAYRSVSKALQAFQDSYLKLTSASKFRSSGFFHGIKTSSTSSAVSATATGSAKEGQMVLDSISQLATASTVSSKSKVTQALTGLIDRTPGATGQLDAAEVDALVAKLNEKSVAFGFNGALKTITFDAQTLNDALAASAATSPEGKLQDALQQIINNTFGTYSEARNPAQTKNTVNVKLQDGVISFDAAGSALSVREIGENNNTLSLLGLTNGQTDTLSLNTKLSALTLDSELAHGETFTFTINGKNFTFDKDQTLADVIQKVNRDKEAGVIMSYSSIKDTFTLTAKETGAAASITVTDDSGNLMAALGLTGNGADKTAGQNAVLSVNGQTIIRSTNTFTIDGVTLTIKEKSDAPISIHLSRDTTELEAACRKFVEEYNQMIDLMQGLVSEKTYQDYQPLSTQQKANMKDTEIKDWEEKAKSGVLRSDPLLMKVSSTLRSVMSSTFVDGFSLAQMGIKSTGYMDNGKLQITEEDFQSALANNGQEIAHLFTSEKGISNKLFDAIEAAVKTSGPKGSRGSLIEAAGINATRSDTENRITAQIEQTKKMIGTLESRLTREEQRLWTKYTAMEKALQRLSSQDAFLSQFTQQNG